MDIVVAGVGFHNSFVVALYFLLLSYSSLIDSNLIDVLF